MNDSFLKRIWDSPRFRLYSLLISTAVGGGLFVWFFVEKQLTYLQERNEDLNKDYQLSREMDQKKCELEQDQMKQEIEKSMYQQYKKLDGKSKEATLFLETYELIKASKTK